MTRGEPAGKTRGLPDPRLVWQPGHTPASAYFDDVYFSGDGGLAESRHVFLRGCGLPEAWQGSEAFTIGELGFGTSRNFLVAWDAWRRTKPPGARLHYIAVEGYPLTRTQLAACQVQWPELAELARALVRVYPDPQAGFHRIFPGDDVFVTLLYGEAAHVLGQLEATVNAWFLDGFSPDKNPAMWRTEVFGEIARLSHANTKLATYSVADEVRRGLDAAGFDVAKMPGYGEKREVLCGVFRADAAPAKIALQPWFARPLHTARTGHAAIVGGGIAGTSAAHALQKRGWRTTIIDRRPALADEASGNPAAVLMPRLTAAPNLDGRFYAAAWRFLQQTLEDVAQTSLLRRCGLLQLATDAAEAARQAAIVDAMVLPERQLACVDAATASDIAGCAVPYPALHFPQGGWLRPRDLCASLATGAHTLLDVDVRGLEHHDGLWQIIDVAGRVQCEADVVILANALGTSMLPQASWMPLKARRGQLTLTPPTAASAALRTVLTYGGYITPVDHGTHCLGATFDWVDAEALMVDPEVTEEDHARNLAELAGALPDLLAGVNMQALAGRAGYRCTTPDHLPMVGPLPDQTAYRRDFAELRHGHPWARYPRADYQPGLYTLTGLGARGFVAGPLAAEILAAHITGEPWPVERDLVTALHPGRFLVRDLKRRDA